jgi:hypothetical protein
MLPSSSWHCQRLHRRQSQGFVAETASQFQGMLSACGGCVQVAQHAILDMHAVLS